MLRDADRGGAAFVMAVMRVVRMAAAGLAVAGCTASGTTLLDMPPSLDVTAFGAAGTGVAAPRTVAFESIDGPPEAVFRRLVTRLGQEAIARKIAVVSREQPAQYRICGYVAAHVQGQRTTINWVWDVFTAGHQRVARISGEMPDVLSARGWAAADDAVVARMAQDGMNRLAAFLAGAEPPDASPVAARPDTQGPMAYLPSRP